ncbi:MAG: hypothetical protein V2J51_06885 [Erythrobacter sp.]|jgi:beta-lactamase superfamily II metal-dependent hydrolase|nr:hypothetical protein [Erythrobacter sp.]
MYQDLRINIHDVGEGSCAGVELPGGEFMLLDCGRHSQSGWSPSIAYAGRRVDLLVVQNLDEDHVRDLNEVLSHCSVKRFLSNPTVTAHDLKWMKDRRDGMGQGVRTAHWLLSNCGPGLYGGLLLESDAAIICFWNHFSNIPMLPWQFADENDLSVPVLISWRGFKILFSGDITDIGWQPILDNPVCYSLLKDVDILVAGHHGRDDGRSERLLSNCRPYATIFSDGRIQYDTQQGMVDWYGRRTIGVVRSGRFAYEPPDRRKVFTTRRDGSITISVDPRGKFGIVPARDERALIGSAA